MISLACHARSHGEEVSGETVQKNFGSGGMSAVPIKFVWLRDPTLHNVN